MDDLKIVFYVLVAVGWVIYNNYRKFAETARKRDPSKPDQPVTEAGTRGSGNTQPPTQRKPVSRPSMREVPVPVKKFKLKPQHPRTQLEKRRSSEPAFLNTGSEQEGGKVIPSRVVHFEEAAISSHEENPILSQLRETGPKTGFIWSEILKRPYN